MSSPLQQALLAQAPALRADAGVPGWYAERQQRALAALAAAPWPVRGQEAWKYTSLHELAQQAPSWHAGHPQAAADADTDADAGSGPDEPVLRFVAGQGADTGALPWLRRLADALAQDDGAVRFTVAREALDGDVFDLANAAFAVDGALVNVPAGHVDHDWRRIEVRHGAVTDPGHWHLAHRIDIGEGAQVRLHLDHRGMDGAGLATVVSRIRVQAGAQLDLAWTRDVAGLACIARTRIDVDAGATLRLHVLDAGAAPSRHDLRIALRGEQARSDLGGVFLLDGRRHADLQLDLRHDAPNAVSRTTWRAIANERARAVFNGHITVAVGADGTDAELNCKSLLGSVQAEIDAKPVLEIYADDVKCAHGATVGQLDAQALFYLRSRGIGAAQAQAMLTRAFAAEAFLDTDGSPAATELARWLVVRA